MKKLLFILIICCSFKGFGQETDSISTNLVLNSSFELIKEQPKEVSELPLAYDWYAPQQSSDLYSRHSRKKEFSIPKNMAGEINTPYGDCYAGFFTTSCRGSAVIYETVEATLKNNLIKGKEYLIEFYISKGTISQIDETSIGVSFSKNKIYTYEDFTNHSYEYDAFFDDYIQLNQTNKWIKISLSYLAKGGERYMSIGNFEPMKERKRNCRNKRGESYYFIDNVSVTENLSTKDSIGIKVTHFESEKEGKLLKDTTIIIEKQ